MFYKIFSSEKKVFFSSEPFSTPEAFLHFLLKDEYFDKRLTISELKEEAVRRFKDTDNLIIIDEAQILDNLGRVYQESLSDTKHFPTFLLSMAKHEGETYCGKSPFGSKELWRYRVKGFTTERITRVPWNLGLLDHGLGT